jgi:hypothetical protein
MVLSSNALEVIMNRDTQGVIGKTVDTQGVIGK